MSPLAGGPRRAPYSQLNNTNSVGANVPKGIGKLRLRDNNKIYYSSYGSPVNATHFTTGMPGTWFV